MSSCPRCRGFLYANRDRYGNYNECLQCGYTIDFAQQAASTTLPGRLPPATLPPPSSLQAVPEISPGP